MIMLENLVWNGQAKVFSPPIKLTVDNNINLASRIIQRIRDSKGITFEEFMGLALYHPEHGYYTSPESKVGEKGDFITSPEVHSFFGKALFLQIVEMWRLMGEPRDITLLELGGGRGKLAGQILSGIMEAEEELYRAVNYRIIEAKPYLDQKGDSQLTADHWLQKVSWFSSIGDAMEEVGDCVILSNEFFDALPFHRIRVKEGRFHEIYVGYDKGFYEFLAPLSSERLKDYIASLDIGFVEGREFEVNLRAVDLMDEIGRLLSRGFVITIDYGCPSKELYSVKHFSGTAISCYKHRVESDLYKRIGQQDITAHVDFTSLCREGEKQGLKVAGFTDQGSFLIGLKVLEELGSLKDEDIEERMAVKNLFMPGGFGDTFKVLVQYKGMEDPPLLRGFSWKNRKERLFPACANGRQGLTIDY